MSLFLYSVPFSFVLFTAFSTELSSAVVGLSYESKRTQVLVLNSQKFFVVNPLGPAQNGYLTFISIGNLNILAKSPPFELYFRQAFQRSHLS